MSDKTSTSELIRVTANFTPKQDAFIRKQSRNTSAYLRDLVDEKMKAERDERRAAKGGGK